MKPSKRDRAALIVLMVGVIALAVDRLLLPPPSAAGGADGLDSASSAVDLPQPDREMRAPPSATAPAPLPGLVPDVFDLSRLAALGSGTPLVDEGQPDETAVEAFVRRHALQATIFGPNPIALVGHRKLRIGDRLDGFVLESISDREAVFLSDTGRAVLHVAPVREKP